MTPEEIARYRVASQQIASTTLTSPGEIVGRLVAMQAQDYLGALWAIGLRLPSAAESDVERAIAERAIVRTWPMRGTLHFVARRDVRWMLELLTPRIIAGAARRHRQLELDDATFGRARELFGEALLGGKQLTRRAMYGALEAAGISTAGQRGIHILSRLAQERLICFGVRQGKQPTFVLLDEWAPDARRMDRDESLMELATCYFSGHGPATLQDFVWWSGLKISDARAGLEMADSHLVRQTSDGKTFWMGPDVTHLPEQPSTAYLLPGFDELLLGYRDRTASLDPRHAHHVHPGSTGMFGSTIVIDGRVIGTWKRTLKRSAVAIVAQPFACLSEEEKQSVAGAAEKYGRFLDMPHSLEILCDPAP